MDTLWIPPSQPPSLEDLRFDRRGAIRSYNNSCQLDPPRSSGRDRCTAYRGIPKSLGPSRAGECYPILQDRENVTIWRMGFSNGISLMDREYSCRMNHATSSRAYKRSCEMSALIERLAEGRIRSFEHP